MFGAMSTPWNARRNGRTQPALPRSRPEVEALECRTAPRAFNSAMPPERVTAFVRAEVKEVVKDVQFVAQKLASQAEADLARALQDLGIEFSVEV